jgi:hypothetical protein
MKTEFLREQIAGFFVQNPRMPLLDIRSYLERALVFSRSVPLRTAASRLIETRMKLYI